MVGIDSISVWGVGIDFDFGVEIRIELVFVGGSKMTSFKCLDRT